MRFFLLATLLFCENHLFSQCVISGKITDSSNNQPIADANVVILIKGKTGILAFTSSDEHGDYKIDCGTVSDSLLIRVTIIGYATKTKLVNTTRPIVDFILSQQITELPTVKVTREPISQKGDTVNYVVASFANKQDRFIGDVIGKIPGIEIDASGAIKYNGKAISTYYINGLNLLESRYSIANQNIPFDMVDRVQVFQNHQPLKILDGLTTSTIPALNIDLKKSARDKFIGNIKAGIGGSPLLMDDAVTGLKFANKIQFISSYKYNNTGIKLSNEIIEQASIQRFGESTPDNAQENMLFVTTLPQPAIQTSRFLFNNNHLLHLSALSEMKNKALLKFNISYLKDIDESNGSARSKFFFPAGDSLVVTEIHKINHSTNNITGNFIYELNTKKKYIKNSFKTETNFLEERGHTMNPDNVLQQLSHPFSLLQNDFTAILPFQKKLLTVHSLTTLSQDNQQLEVSPGAFPDIFNDSAAYQKTTQYISLRKLISKNNLGFIAGNGNMKQSFKMGADLTIKDFVSTIEKSLFQSSKPLSDSFRNDISLRDLRFYATARTTLKKGNTLLEIELPLEWSGILTTNRISGFWNIRNKTYFNPSVTLVIPLSSVCSVDMGYAVQNMTGDFLQTTKGFILTTYRSISQKDTLLPFQLSKSYTLNVSCKNPLAALFYNFSVSYSTIQKNLMTDRAYQNFYTRVTSIEIPNRQTGIRANVNVNKYLLSSKTNLLFTCSYGNSKSLQFQANKLVDVSSQETSIGFKINFDGFNYMSVENSSNLNYSKNEIQTSTNPVHTVSFFQLRQEMKLYFFLPKNRIIYFNSSYYKLWDNASKSNNYFFGDIGVKQKLKKIDFQLELKNIANLNTYTTIFLTDNLRQVTQTQIRPRSVLIQCFFNF